ncbi:major capsid protein [Paracoccus sp. 22332]|uniref:major capsid protein n=1 Tax=Paracoccus sp. 22332 TaxID=3453913 RepID=UPI003F8701C4
MASMNIFENDAFSVVQLTQSINRIRFKAGRIGQMGLFGVDRISTTVAMVEVMDNGLLRIVGPTPRGGPGNTLPKGDRDLIPLLVPHFEINDAVNADEVQNIRAFGTESDLETVVAKVNQRQALHVDSFALTEEHTRMGAITGQIVYQKASDGKLYMAPLNLYTAFGIAAPAAVAFDMDSTDGTLRKQTQDVIRQMGNIMGGSMFSRVHAFVGDDFFDRLLMAPEIRDSFKGTSEAEWLRAQKVTHGLDGASWGAFEYGGIVFENYRGGTYKNTADEDVSFIPADEARFFPVGVPGLFQTVYAPADYEETVNTLGERLYTKQWPSLNGKRRELESQMNALQYCSNPGVLIRGTIEP